MATPRAQHFRHFEVGVSVVIFGGQVVEINKQINTNWNGVLMLHSAHTSLDTIKRYSTLCSVWNIKIVMVI